MAQVKIFGLRTHLNPIKTRLSDVIHSCLVDALKLPAEKRFHRFFSLDNDDFVYPADRTQAYTIIEISMFEGRSVEAKKGLIRLIIARLGAELNIRSQDVEITIFESPRHDWGIRGLPGDELGLDYKVEV
jgi:phenylpyruvate tautomerase PptA (4-oxalocrotonate tautomerase family)